MTHPSRYRPHTTLPHPPSPPRRRRLRLTLHTVAVLTALLVLACLTHFAVTTL